MPLTHDHNALKETIEQLQFGWVSQGGTNLEKVVRLALQTFKRDKEADSKNALVILSDGEDTVNVTYKTAEAARQSKLIIVTAGIGTTIGTTIPDENSPSGAIPRPAAGSMSSPGSIRTACNTWPTRQTANTCSSRTEPPSTASSKTLRNGWT